MRARRVDAYLAQEGQRDIAWAIRELSERQHADRIIYGDGGYPDRQKTLDSKAATSTQLYLE